MIRNRTHVFWQVEDKWDHSGIWPIFLQGDVAAAPSQGTPVTDHIWAVTESLAPSGITKNVLLHYIISPKVQENITCKSDE